MSLKKDSDIVTSVIKDLKIVTNIEKDGTLYVKLTVSLVYKGEMISTDHVWLEEGK